MKYGYKQIADILTGRIRAGEYPPGSKLPSEHTLSEEFAVERTTLRRALTVLVEAGLIVKRPGIGSLVSDRASPMIAFIGFRPKNGIYSLTHHFNTPVYEHFIQICTEAGYSTVSMMIGGANHLDRFAELASSATALVLVDNVPTIYLDYITAHRIPCVLMSMRAPGFRSVICDNDDGLRQAIAHLVACGHQRIAHIGGAQSSLNARARVVGFRNAMQMQFPGAPILPPSLCGWAVSDGERATHALLDTHPGVTAICGVNDLVACGAVRAIRARGLQVPEDIAVIGFGNTVDPETVELPLTTVSVSFERIARELWHALEVEMQHPFCAPATVLVETELIVRATTVPQTG